LGLSPPRCLDTVSEAEASALKLQEIDRLTNAAQPK
jgi:hypothetical protein